MRKLYEYELQTLQDLSSQEKTDYLIGVENDTRSLIQLLRERASDTNDPELYLAYLDKATCYICYGIELIAERIGVDIDTVDNDADISAIDAAILDETAPQ